jgi:hypothetical protein
VLSRIVPETMQRFEIRSPTPFLEEYIAGIKQSASPRSSAFARPI